MKTHNGSTVANVRPIVLLALLAVFCGLRPMSAVGAQASADRWAHENRAAVNEQGHGGGELVRAIEAPNFVWLISEDNSKHFLRLFDDNGVETPNIAALAESGLLFSHAFSNAPVCSVARSTLISSCFAPRIGAQFHRRSKLVPMPPGLKMFPAYLREAGYYTTNRSKTDYNLIAPGNVWDDSSKKASWRNRKSGQPFFHKQSFAQTHEGSLHFNRRQMEAGTASKDFSDVFVPPIHPQTEIFKFAYGRYRERIQKMDEQVGAVVEELRSDGLLESTFIFYFADHGGVLPGSKGYAYETGLHIPLVVRIPEQYRESVQFQRGQTVNGFVSFVDFGPTLLNLAGIKVPPQMDGKPFLGPGRTAGEIQAQDATVGYADRFDEKYDLVRTLRVGNWKYVRSFQPYNYDGLHNNYRYKMLAYRQWRTLFERGELDSVQSRFFETRPAEMLFDVETDPYETRDLSQSAEHQQVLLELRAKLAEHLQATNDLSFFPESVLYETAFDGNPVEYGQQKSEEIRQLIAIANIQLDEWVDARGKLVAAINASDATQRYWALIAANSFSQQWRGDEPFIDLVVSAAGSANILERTRALECFGLAGLGMDGQARERNDDSSRLAAALVGCLRQTENPVEAALVLNSIVLLRDGPAGLAFPSQQLELADSVSGYQDVQRRLEYLGWRVIE